MHEMGMKIEITEEMRACLRMIREADAQGAKLAHDFPASFACYAAKATGAIDLARLISEAVEQAEKGGRDA